MLHNITCTLTFMQFPCVLSCVFLCILHKTLTWHAVGCLWTKHLSSFEKCWASVEARNIVLTSMQIQIKMLGQCIASTRHFSVVVTITNFCIKRNNLPMSVILNVISLFSKLGIICSTMKLVNLKEKKRKDSLHMLHIELCSDIFGDAVESETERLRQCTQIPWTARIFPVLKSVNYQQSHNLFEFV